MLVDAIVDYAIYMLSPDGIITSWNRGAERFKGYTADEIIGQHFSRFYTEEDRATGLPAHALKTAETEGRFEREGWRVRKDGSRMWAHVIIDPVRDPAGRLVGFAKITRDMTERKAVQDSLRWSEQRFQLLVQGIRDYAIYMLGPDGRVTNWNTGAERLKGYTEQEIVGEHFSRFYTPEDRASGLPDRALAMAIREGRFEQEGWRVRKDGSRFRAHALLQPIYDEQGTLVGFGKITRDVTLQHEAQRALEEARAALFQSQKLETIGQLTGGIAHDFNNLLAVIIGNLDLLRKRLPEEGKARQLVENSLQAARRGASLTGRMLAFARRQELQVASVDVPDLVRGLAEMLQGSIGPTITIETRFPLRIPPVLVDPGQLEAALINLVVNARDAMPGGGVVTIAAQEQRVERARSGPLPPGTYVCLSVTDEGEGMDEATLGKAVEPFFTTKGVGKGTGLGLSMIHGFAEQSGGRLILKSRRGEGTRAEIWLPVAASEAGQGLQAELEADESAPVRRLTVLVVDDDALVLMNTADMLEDLGHAVLEANSGEQALRVLARAREVDLVITDQAMPGMLGTQLVSAIRAERPDLPVILATGYAEAPASPDARLPRLGKPFTQQDLARALAAAMNPDADRSRVLRFRPRQA